MICIERRRHCIYCIWLLCLLYHLTTSGQPNRKGEQCYINLCLYLSNHNTFPSCPNLSTSVIAHGDCSKVIDSSHLGVITFGRSICSCVLCMLCSRIPKDESFQHIVPIAFVQMNNFINFIEKSFQVWIYLISY